MTRARVQAGPTTGASVDESSFKICFFLICLSVVNESHNTLLHYDTI